MEDPIGTIDTAFYRIRYDAVEQENHFRIVLPQERETTNKITNLCGSNRSASHARLRIVSGLKIPRRNPCRFDSGPGHHLIFQTVQESLMNPLSLWDGGFFVG